MTTTLDAGSVPRRSSRALTDAQRANLAARRGKRP